MEKITAIDYVNLSRKDYDNLLDKSLISPTTEYTLMANPSVNSLILNIAISPELTMIGRVDIIPLSSVSFEDNLDICGEYCEEITMYAKFSDGNTKFVVSGLYFFADNFNKQGSWIDKVEKEMIPEEDYEDSTHGVLRECAQLFNVIQLMMMTNNSHLTYKKKYKKQVSKELIAPYTTPQKVKVYQLRKFTDLKIKELKETIRQYERHCPAWGVRGHYRHYKDGKVVYIKPHIKGQFKELYIGRSYDIDEQQPTIKNWK